jgi:hypothetical protein
MDSADKGQHSPIYSPCFSTGWRRNTLSPADSCAKVSLPLLEGSSRHDTVALHGLANYLNAQVIPPTMQCIHTQQSWHSETTAVRDLADVWIAQVQTCSRCYNSPSVQEHQFLCTCCIAHRMISFVNVNLKQDNTCKCTLCVATVHSTVCTVCTVAFLGCSAVGSVHHLHSWRARQPLRRITLNHYSIIKESHYQNKTVANHNKVQVN